MLGILSFSDRERALPPSKEIFVLTFVVKKKYYDMLSGMSILENRRDNLTLIIIHSKYFPDSDWLKAHV